MTVYINPESKKHAQVSEVRRSPIRLPKDGHLMDFQGMTQHESEARSWIPNIDRLKLDHQKQIIEAIGYIGHISKINVEDGTLLIACSCGACFLANINDFTELGKSPDPDKIKPYR